MPVLLKESFWFAPHLNCKNINIALAWTPLQSKSITLGIYIAFLFKLYANYPYILFIFY